MSTKAVALTSWWSGLQKEAKIGLIALPIIVVAYWFLSGGSSNPLIGHWEAKDPSRSYRHFPTEITFTEEYYVTPNAMHEVVGYEIHDDEVHVLNHQGGWVISIVGRNEIALGSAGNRYYMTRAD